MRLRAPQSGGGTLRDHLMSAYRQTGRMHPDLMGDPAPEPVAHIMTWFDELQVSRPNSGFGVSMIPFAEIDAWARLTGRAPSSFEVTLLRDIDMVFVNSTMTRLAEKGKSQ